MAGGGAKFPSAKRPSSSIKSSSSSSREILTADFLARVIGLAPEVLSADAYAAFEETVGADGQPSIETGRRYRKAILEAGGSRPAMESFKEFRGREPQLDALLRHQGMSQ